MVLFLISVFGLIPTKISYEFKRPVIDPNLHLMVHVLLFLVT